MYQSIRPGKIWLDTNGKRIQAHGGSIIVAEGKFWWYGEDKEGITGTATGEACPYRHHGVKAYSSTDLYNWQDEGHIVPESEEENHPFHPARIMDRPHILYNAKTKKYVLWAKSPVNGNFSEGTFAVCVGDSLRTLRFVKEVRFNNLQSGDFDMFETDGKGYIVYETPHTCMILQELTEDYTDLSPVYSEHLALGTPPFIREAPAYFERGGRRYLLTSGTTGYYPNPTIAYDITDLHGEWKELGDPCVDDRAKNSFHAQFSSVFRHPTVPDLYIALGDRWLTDLPVDLPDMEGVLLGFFQPGKGVPFHGDLSELSDENTSVADYVWLPVTFSKEGAPVIEWRRQWRIEEK